jgi:uncharacterized membrane protein
MEELPGDLVAAVAIAALTLVFSLIEPFATLPIRVPLGLLMVLFLPGYALIAALFPRKDDLDGIERAALSFGLSIAIVPLIGLALNYTPWGIRLVPVAVSLCLFTFLMSSAAAWRRLRVEKDSRYSVEFKKQLGALHSELMVGKTSRVDKALTIILIITIILSVSALVYIIITPKQGEKFTEFYILGSKGKAYDYPTSVVSGQNCTVIVGIVNHEYATVNYTLRMAVQNYTFMSKDLRLDHNQTWEDPIIYAIQKQGNNQKLEFLLYKEQNFTVPYRDLHLWVNVSAKNSSTSIIGESHQ